MKYSSKFSLNLLLRGKGGFRKLESFMKSTWVSHIKLHLFNYSWPKNDSYAGQLTALGPLYDFTGQFPGSSFYDQP